MNTRENVTAAILEIAKNTVPSVKWATKLVGANRGGDIEGSVSCDRIDYTYKAKGLTFAQASYSVYIVDVNSVDGVDGFADELFDALHDSDLNGTCVKALITRVQYGAANGYPNVGVVLLTLEAQYQI